MAVLGGVVQENEADREARLRELASELFFTLKSQGSRLRSPDGF